MPLFRRLQPVPPERPSLEALVFPDQEPLKKRRSDVLRVTSEALDRAGKLSLTPELAAFAEAFSTELSSLTTELGDGPVWSPGRALPEVIEAVKLGAAFAECAELLSAPPFATVDPVTACAKNFAAYRHTHFEPNDLGIMAYFSTQCGFHLPLTGAKSEDLLPPPAGILDAANRGAPAYEAVSQGIGLVWDNLAGE